MDAPMHCHKDLTTIKGTTTTRMSPFSLITYSYEQDEYKKWRGEKLLKNSQCRI